MIEATKRLALLRDRSVATKGEVMRVSADDFDFIEEQVLKWCEERSLAVRSDKEGRTLFKGKGIEVDDRT